MQTRTFYSPFPSPASALDLHERFSGPFEYTFGALPRVDGTVRFRIWAPNVGQVALELEGQPPKVMEPRDAGYHQIVVPCLPGARYRYRIDREMAVPDPASRLQSGGVHGASVVLGTGNYPWLHDDWRGRPWKETVLYEIHCGLAGGFRGVEHRLPQLAGLGITAVELMPIAQFPGSRNWGYDGVMPYAPSCSYGTPADLKRLVDTAHGLGIMMFLDVVYNHFGPDGNYLSSYAADFFRTDVNTPWGPAIDFRQAPVRDFFKENALFWLREYRFDGLRFDAVHAITEPGWLVEMAQFVREHIQPDRHVHLVLENDDNTASLMKEGFNAQWNDDAHHVLHHLLTGETQGYYGAYAQQPTENLARFLAEGFVYQGQPSLWRAGKPRGEPSADLSPTCFIFFLQNHDQIGNRAFGERLVSLCGSASPALHAAVTLQLLTPHIPLLFMGEEVGATTPFQYFTGYDDPALARAVREGRRNEFAAFLHFIDPREQVRIPDPNAMTTWQRSLPACWPADIQGRDWRDWYRRLLALRAQFITPYLDQARSAGVDILASRAVHAKWILGNGSLLSIYCNLAKEPCICPEPAGESADFTLFASKKDADKAIHHGCLPAVCTVAVLLPAPNCEVPHG